jgi:tape measure domain-containing protein
VPGKQYPLSVVIEAVDKLTAPMRRINQAINDTFKPVRMLSARLSALSQESGLTRLAGSFSNLGGSITNAWDKARGLAGTLTGLAATGIGAGYAFKRFFIDPAANYEQLSLSLTAIEGSAEKAKKSLGFIDKLAFNTPFTMSEVGATFRMMRGFGMDPLNGSLQAISMQRVALQLGQAFSKGKLQAEDANILVENGIPVWQLLADAAARFGKKIPIPQLQKLSSEGKLGQKSIQELITQMGIASQGAALMMQKSWNGLLSNISDTWDRFARAVMQAGVFDYLKSRLQMVLDWVERLQKTGEWDALVKRVSTRILETLQALWEFGTQLWSVMSTAFGWLKRIHDFFGSWKPLIVAVGLVLAGPFLLSLIGIATAVGSLVVAFSTLGGGALVALTGIGIGLYAIWQTAKEVPGKIMAAWDGLKDWASNLVDSIVGAFTRGFQTITNMVQGVRGFLPSWAGGITMQQAAAPSLGGVARGAPVASGAPVATGLTRPAPAKTQAITGGLTFDFTGMPQGVRVAPQKPQGFTQTLNFGTMMGAT